MALNASIDNANTASSTEPNLFIASTAYNARGQTASITYGNGLATAANTIQYPANTFDICCL